MMPQISLYMNPLDFLLSIKIVHKTIFILEIIFPELGLSYRCEHFEALYTCLIIFQNDTISYIVICSNFIPGVWGATSWHR